VLSPNPSGVNFAGLTSVACPTSTSCTAVGQYHNSSGDHTLMEQWNHPGWSVVASPTPAGHVRVTVNGVACARSNSCYAVGQYAGNLWARTLIEHWDGTTWAIVPSPNPNKTFANYEMLNGISCVNDSNCNAVGSYLTPAFVRLVEHWNGSSWSIVPT